ncbi:hypothetical protein SAMN04487765_3680 [Tenacibaculum sp. MAR_2010_89]|uniref:hypothetical protein n=1 Tax=Tenacibaculum sp. MAR_2010_89 TaxID=1250198 RepID=UPI000899F9E1|nr:hypothetical protein [Tenacibaculum sp. MAR_2010_89]SEE66459.1 hypothetical protein SAMN04487765_3680 [Tenacibaculum sp. MAR_2010_89]
MKNIKILITKIEECNLSENDKVDIINKLKEKELDLDSVLTLLLKSLKISDILDSFF